jgi:hypothetical protein
MGPSRQTRSAKPDVAKPDAVAKPEAAKQKLHRAGPQQGLARRDAGLAGRLFAIKQHGLTNRDLIAGLKLVFHNAFPIEECPGAAALVKNAVAVSNRLDHAVTPGNAGLIQMNGRIWRTANAGVLRTQWKTFAQPGTCYGEQLTFHLGIQKECSSDSRRLTYAAMNSSVYDP